MEPRAFKPRKRSTRKELVCEKCGEKFTNTPLWAKHTKVCKGCLYCHGTGKAPSSDGRTPCGFCHPSPPKRTIDDVMASIMKGRIGRDTIK